MGLGADHERHGPGLPGDVNASHTRFLDRLSVFSFVQLRHSFEYHAFAWEFAALGGAVMVFYGVLYIVLLSII